MRSKAPHHLLALSSAAVFAIYGAGFMRTRAAAARFSDVPAMKRPALNANEIAGPHVPMPAPPVGEQKAADVAPPPAKVAALAIAQRAVDASAKATTRAPASIAPAATNETLPADVATTPAETAGLVALAAPANVAPAPLPAPAAVPAATPAAVPAPAAARAKYVDGKYQGWGTCRHGDIQAEIVIEKDRIISAVISRCETRYTCDWIAPLPPQVVARQSAEVDFVSGATQSTNAFYYAILEALGKARN